MFVGQCPGWWSHGVQFQTQTQLCCGPFQRSAEEHRPSVPPKAAGSVFLLFIVIVSPQPPFVSTPREGRVNIDQMVVAIYGVNTMCSLSFSLAPFSGTVESEVFWFNWSGKLKNLDLGVWSWSMGVKRVIMMFCLLFNSDREALNTICLCSYHLS